MWLVVRAPSKEPFRKLRNLKSLMKVKKLGRETKRKLKEVTEDRNQEDTKKCEKIDYSESEDWKAINMNQRWKKEKMW
jgi:hypothetical protein